jgi:hypothetical protein
MTAPKHCPEVEPDDDEDIPILGPDCKLKTQTYEIKCPCGKNVSSKELGHYKCKECGRTALLQWNTPEASKPRPNQYLRGPVAPPA